MYPKFVNFSNHPSEKWDEAQLAAAQVYGEVKDFTFPTISPKMSSNEVKKLAEEYVEIILKKFGMDIIVHVMGEMTFTFMVVTRLKEMGIKCIASTTERKTTYASDGTKLSEFSFVKFREY